MMLLRRFLRSSSVSNFRQNRWRSTFPICWGSAILLRILCSYTVRGKFRLLTAFLNWLMAMMFLEGFRGS